MMQLCGICRVCGSCRSSHVSEHRHQCRMQAVQGRVTRPCMQLPPCISLQGSARTPHLSACFLSSIGVGSSIGSAPPKLVWLQRTSTSTYSDNHDPAHPDQLWIASTGMPLIWQPAKAMGCHTPACFDGSAHDTALDIKSLLSHDVNDVDSCLLQQRVAAALQHLRRQMHKCLRHEAWCDTGAAAARTAVPWIPRQ